MLHLQKDKVAITPIFDPPKTAGGIWIPEQAQERCDQGIVKYIGPEVNSISIGDYVLFPNYVGTLMALEDEGHIIIMREQYITAIIGGDGVSLTQIPGLYYIDESGDPIVADYEQVFTMISAQFANIEWRKKFQARDKQSEVELEKHYYPEE